MKRLNMLRDGLNFLQNGLNLLRNRLNLLQNGLDENLMEIPLHSDSDWCVGAHQHVVQCSLA